MEFIREHMSQDELFAQLAEECCELGADAAKMARILRGKSPSPVLPEDCLQNVIEEFTDVCLCAEAAGISVNQAIKNAKLRRWEARLTHGNEIQVST